MKHLEPIFGVTADLWKDPLLDLDTALAQVAAPTASVPVSAESRGSMSDSDHSSSGNLMLNMAMAVHMEFYGGSGNDTSYGGAGNDYLSGGTGADTLAGGAGNDTYIFIFDGGDVITEAHNAGTDQVNSEVSYTFGANFEILVLGGTAAINGTGNSLANRLMGNDGNNMLNGSVGADTLVGGAGADTLLGGTGADRLLGGAGRDVLRGGTADGAADVFVFNAVSASPPGAAKRDVIYDFVSGIDNIQLTGIDANTVSEGNQAFAWGATTAAAHTVWYVVSGTSVLLRGDVNGNTAYDFEIQIADLATLAAGDVIL